MPSLLRNVVLFLWVRGSLGTSSTHTSNGDTTAGPSTTTTVSIIQVAGPTTTTPASSAALSSSRTTTGTCPNRTANYITNPLAQQCLRADRVPQNAIQASTPKSENVTNPPSTSPSPDVTVTLTQTVQALTDTVTLEASVPDDQSQQTVNATSTPTSSAATSGQNEETSKPSVEAEDDVDSPLDNANFLSFEEWKKQNLAKAGQSPDDIGRGQPVDANRPRPGINNALDTLGEEQEISLDFAGFGGGPHMPVAESQMSRSTGRPSATMSATPQDPAAQSLRSKDAGKTCKERTNYASFDCAATILKSNKECKSASSVLVENKDSYMLNICSADNKFFIVELCDDIQIDTIVLANYEFFSSSFRHFRISVSDRYPVKMEKWRDLGTFEARNTREIQAFLVPNPLIWARYLRIEFLSHYGTEYYCPVSVLRVHGTTMWEDYRHQEELARGEEEEATLEVEALATPPVVQEPLESTDEVAKATLQAIPEVETPVTASVATPESVQDMVTNASDAVSNISSAPLQTVTAESATEPEPDDATTASQATETVQTKVANVDVAANTTEVSSFSKPSVSSEAVQAVSYTSAVVVVNSSTVLGDATSTTLSPAISSNSTSGDLEGERASERSQNTSETTVMSGNATLLTANVTMANATNQTASPTNATRANSSTTTVQSPQPSTQESFFKSFHKRLQQLESNSTLSLQYIEEQSRILRDAFTKVEKRQLATSTKFLSQLNDTVMAELHGFRQSYDQLWQSTVIELEGQRETYQREMLALSSRLTMVADELVWQKRMGIIQSTLLLLCLALAIFGRSENGYFEVPSMQQMMNKSTTALAGSWDSPPNSPSPDSRSPVSLFRRKLWRSSPDPDRSASDSEMSRPKSRDQPNITIEPPSPNVQKDGYFDEQDAHSPPEKELSEDKRGSPKKQRKKAKKLQGSPHNNGRAKSPLAM